MATRIRFYIDFKSPYAYLAKDPARDLARETGATIEWLPYTLDIPAYLGSAKVGGSGDVLEESRNAHQWRRVKYSYMDCRREANRRGLVIRGTRKIFDSSLAHIGLLWAKRQGAAIEAGYIDVTYERFWKRELDIENPEIVAATLNECGADIAGFAAWLGGEGRAELLRLQREAEAAGVFGAPLAETSAGSGALLAASPQAKGIQAKAPAQSQPPDHKTRNMRSHRPLASGSCSLL